MFIEVHIGCTYRKRLRQSWEKNGEEEVWCLTEQLGDQPPQFSPAGMVS